MSKPWRDEWGPLFAAILDSCLDEEWQAAIKKLNSAGVLRERLLMQGSLTEDEAVQALWAELRRDKGLSGRAVHKAFNIYFDSLAMLGLGRVEIAADGTKYYVPTDR